MPIGFVLVLGGCAADDQTATRTQGAAGGAAFGALLGGLVGGNTKSALLGGLAGGTAGLVAGEVVARRKSAYQTEENLIEGETVLAQQRASEVEAYNDDLRQDIASLQRDISDYYSTIARGQADRSRAETLKQTAEQRLNQANTRLAEVEEELDTTRSLYTEASAGTDTRGLDDWQRTIEDLEEERAELTALIDDLKASAGRLS